MIAKGKYKGLEPIAVCGLFNTASMNIYIIDGDDMFVVAGVNDKPARKYKLYTDYGLTEEAEGTVEQYFKYGQCKYLLSDFMKVEGFYESWGVLA